MGELAHETLDRIFGVGGWTLRPELCDVTGPTTMEPVIQFGDAEYRFRLDMDDVHMIELTHGSFLNLYFKLHAAKVQGDLASALSINTRGIVRTAFRGAVPPSTGLRDADEFIRTYLADDAAALSLAFIIVKAQITGVPRA